MSILSSAILTLPPGGGGGGTVTGTGVATRVAFWTSASAIGSDSNLYWDNTSKFLGIGTSAPATFLDIQAADDDEFIRLSSTGDSVGIYSGDNNPNTFISAESGSIFLRTSGAVYVNTDGLTAWTQLSTGGGTVGGSGSATQVAFWDSGTTITGENALWWDSTNDRLGIGTSTPSAALDVDGSADVVQLHVKGHSTQTSNIFLFEKDDGTDLLTLDNLGNLRPGTNNTQDLGGNTFRWMDIFLGPGTLHIGTSELDEGLLYYDTATNIFHIDTDATTNGDIAFQTDDLYLDKSTGRVGINTTTPGFRFTVVDTDVSLLGTKIMSALTFTADPAANSAATFISGLFGVETDTSNTFNVGALDASRSSAIHQGTGIVTTMRGSAALLTNADTGTITNAFNFETATTNSTTGTITNARGVMVNDPSNPSGTITNWHGIYIDTSTAATNNYAAYFGDNVGIGTAAPAKKLHIAGVDDEELIRLGTTGDSVGIFSGDNDPNITPVTGEAGSIFMRTNGSVYVNTNGITTWALLSTGGGTVGGTGTATQVAFWDSGTTITGDSGLYWDNTFVKRLGIGTSTPLARLHIDDIGDFKEYIRMEFATDYSSIWSGATDPNGTSGARGSIWLRTDTGAVYVNTNDATTWVQLGTGNGTVTGTGTATRVAFWDTATSISSDSSLYWDNTSKFLGVGTSTPGAAFDIDGNADVVQLRVKGHSTQTSNILLIEQDGGTDLLTMGNAGHLLPGTDDAQDLGSSSLRWRDLYLGPATLHIGTSTTDEGTISYDTTGNIFNFATDATTNGDIAFFTDDLYLDKSTGFVGVNTTTPVARFTTLDTSTATSGSPALTFFSFIANPGANSTASYLSGNFLMQSETTNVFDMTQLISILARTRHEGTGTVSTADSIFASLTNADTGIINTARVITGSLANSSTGTMGDARMFEAGAPINSGGTINTYHALYLNKSTAATNNYGAYIGDFVGINVTTPATLLHIKESTADTEYIRLDNNTVTVGHYFGAGSPNGVVTATTGSIYQRTTGGEMWINTSLVSGTTWTQLASGGGTVGGSGAATQVAYWDSATTIAGENALWWDPTNDRLGIGTNTPAYPLDITFSSTSATSGTYPGFKVENTNVIGGTSYFIDSLWRTNSSAGGTVDVKIAVAGSNTGDGAPLPFLDGLRGGGIGTDNAYPFLIVTNQIVRGFFDTSGRFGLGNTNVTPAFVLDIHFDTATADGLVLNNNNANADVIVGFNDTNVREWTIGVDDTDGNFKFGQGSLTSDVAVTITGGITQKVGIRTVSPVYPLDIIFPEATITDGAAPSIRLENTNTTAGQYHNAELLARTYTAGSGLPVDVKLVSAGMDTGSGNPNPFLDGVLGGGVGTATNFPFMITTNDVVRIYTDTSGHFAFNYGATAPVFTLDVQFDTATADGLVMRNNNANADIIVGFNDSGTREWTIGRDDTDATGTNKFKFGQAALTTDVVMTFTDGLAPKVGIRTEAPTFPLDINFATSSTTPGIYPGIKIENTTEGGSLACFTDVLLRTADDVGAGTVDTKMVCAGTSTFTGAGNPFLDGIRGGGVGTATTHPFMLVTDDAVRQFVDTDGDIGMGTTTPSGQLHVDQSSTTGAQPVFYVNQADVSEEFIRFQGTSANANLTQSIVDAADVTLGTIAGYAKVFVIDDGNQITDQAYFIPLYTLV